MSGLEPLWQTHSANPNTENFPFTDLTHLQWPGCILRGSQNHANQHEDVEWALAWGAESEVSATCGN